MTEPAKPTVPEVVPLVRALYDSPDGGAGHCLHTVLDDGNISDSNVDWCVDLARERDCERCVELGLLLRRMSRTQRLKVRRDR